MIVSACVRHTCLSGEKERLEVCISGWNSMCQPYIESTTILFDYYEEELGALFLILATSSD